MAGERHGHGMAGERHGRGMAGERHGRGMRMACYVLIGLYSSPIGVEVNNS